MKKALFLLSALALSSQGAWALDSAPQAMPTFSPTLSSSSETMGGVTEKQENTGLLYGRVRSVVSLINYQEGTTNLSYNNTHTDARLGYVATSKVEGWTASGTIEFELQSDADALSTRFLYVTLENEDLSYRLGRQEPGGSTLGGKYLQKIDESLTIGETIGKGDYFTLELKNYNLRFVVGRNASAKDLNPTNGLPPMDENAVACFFESGDEGLQFAASGTFIDERASRAQIAPAGANLAPEFYSGMAFAVSAPVGESSRLSFNFDRTEEFFLNSRVANIDYTGIAFWDQDLGDNYGQTLALSVRRSTDQTSNPTAYASVDYSYVKQIGFVRVYGGLSVNQTQDADSTNGTIQQSQVGVGMSAHFK